MARVLAFVAVARDLWLSNLLLRNGDVRRRRGASSQG